MQVPVFCAVLVVVGSHFGHGAPLTDVKEMTADDIKQVLTNVPQENWQTFLKEETRFGYRIQLENEDWDDREEAELAVGIFNYFVDHQEEIRKTKELLNGAILTDIICFQEPIGCIDTDDYTLRPTA